ncbi:hypothetical protein BC939DRAFT_448134 [Gamsiella multidivaricata]|uniref:uncharacterized protein n=1 Tax=Gamsiella multidivaricata TaxID=101098 RepID=UPI00221F9D75|nr:uncharacterized protein BC939DRAFT_448134 [Gamsiella multidivaricata]KAI7825694.1 hypothetical protein BC939DRAFT_448134 [Gamsiella multidivaricata]
MEEFNMPSALFQYRYLSGGCDGASITPIIYIRTSVVACSSLLLHVIVNLAILTMIASALP